MKVKSGWAAAVLVGGSRAAPQVLAVDRLELSDPDTPASVQPYHAGFGTAQTDMRVVRRLIQLVERCARSSITALLRRYQAAGHAPRAAVAIGTSATDPDTITNPHIRIHALEGQLFRRVVIDAFNAKGIPCSYVLEQAVLTAAPAALDLTGAALKQQLAALKPSVDGPWRTEQKVAALAAWMLLDTRGAKRR